ncbi:short chain dehydrogenase [Sulfuriferula plumbiphila]|uniref:Short chain dehydrogenase n=1 Tax=Sulfuriferula plumbiphila TaxID=171865 RepID=A0A512L713_9PROT|nr:SDR family oxidoreductase [Sulfuriferula plumbiphila]BBP02891.1 short chain dehydrogenase [Sulfuriferula plumbiphila]GEP30242.1 short chain dehydrogenase [Sulfuriferula plumbiphila]
MNTQRPLAVVTGAGKRLGLTITQTLLENGWEILALVRTPSAALNALAASGQGVHIIQHDVADPAVWFDLWPSLRARFGRLPEALVHAASLFEHDTAASSNWAAIEAHRRINYDSFVAAASAWLQCADATQRGAFVALVDQKVLRLNPDHYAYTLSKLNLAASIPFLAQALAPQLRVNGVAPGLTLPSGGQTDADFHAAQAVFPLGAGLAPGDIANAVLFLLGQPWITGQLLAVDGGQHLQSDCDLVLRAPP